MRSIRGEKAVITCVSLALLLGFSGSSTAVFAAAMRLADLSRMSPAASRTSHGETEESAGMVAAMPRAEATNCLSPSAVL